MENKIRFLTDELNKKESLKIEELQKKILSLNETIEKYKSKTINQGIIYNPGDRIISVNFVSMGNQDIMNYSIACKSSDLFVRLEEKLYADFPQFKEYETFFEVKAKRIKRFKTLEENKINNNDVISIFIIDIK